MGFSYNESISVDFCIYSPQFIRAGDRYIGQKLLKRPRTLRCDINPRSKSGHTSDRGLYTNPIK
jgi:hypothetical protein